MKETTRKLITWCGLGVAIIATILSILFAMNNGDVKELAAVKANGLFDATFWILVCLIALSIIAIVWFLIVKLAKRFKEDKGYWKKFLGIVLAIVVVCVLAFVLSKGNDVSLALMEKKDISESTSKLIGAACYVVYILVIAAALAIVYTEVAKSFKKK
ncbi:MAG: hypothetical protein IKR33_00605 [Bacteroidales bacterium]|nr:hypothetical protein [Bacteroidales bacterium]